MIAKKSDGSQAKEKESTDSSTTIEDEDVKGKSNQHSHISSILEPMIKFSWREKSFNEKKRRFNEAEAGNFFAFPRHV